MNAARTAIDGIEVFRCASADLWNKGDTFHLAVRVVALLNHLPVVQREGDKTVLYAVRPGLIRKLKRVEEVAL